MSERTQEHAFNWTGYKLGPNTRTAVGDLDGDGRLETVAACCSGESGSGRLYLFDWDGRTFVKVAEANLGMIERINKLIVADLTGDRRGEIIIGTDNYFFIYQWNGSRLVRVFQSRYLGGNVSDIAVGKVTGSHVGELVISIRGVGVQVYQWNNNSFTLLAEIDAPNAMVAVGDVDGDRLEEIVVLQLGRGLGRDLIEIFTFFEGQLVLDITIRLTVAATGPIALADLNRNGRKEIFLATDRGRRVLVLGYNRGNFERLALTRSLPGVVRALFGANWDQRAGNELVVGLHNAILVFKLERGQLEMIANVEAPGTITDLSFGDLDRDGRVEIVIGTQEGDIFFLRVIIKIIITPPRPPVPIIEPIAQFLIQENVTVPPDFPEIISVGQVTVRPAVTRVEVISNKVIISGYFDVNVLVVVEPDRRVLSFETRIPFTHFVHIPGLTRRHRVKVDIEVVFAEARFDPLRPREINIVIVAEIFVFDHVVLRGETLYSLASQWNVTPEIIMEINRLPSEMIEPGQKLKMPFLE